MKGVFSASIILIYSGSFAGICRLLSALEISCSSMDFKSLPMSSFHSINPFAPVKAFQPQTGETENLMTDPRPWHDR